MKSKKKAGALPRRQMEVMRMLARRHDGLFPFPEEVVEQIGRPEPAEDSEINQALQHAANATKEDVGALLKMLDEDPTLLLEAGNIVTPGGLDCRRITIYEFCLGAGDPELAAEVQKRFANLKSVDGEAERQRQYELYKPHIDTMLNQQPYDFTKLLNALKNAAPEDVKALREGDMTHKSDLRDAIIQFRKDHAPKKLLQPGMHYNYATLQQAFELIDIEWGTLKAASNDNYDKLDFFSVLVIGFLQRRLPGIDRGIFAQGLYSIIGGAPVARTLKYAYGGGSFDPTPSDAGALGESGAHPDLAYLGALGFKNYAWRAASGTVCGRQGAGIGMPALGWWLAWRTSIEQKHQAYSACQTHPAVQPKRPRLG